MHIRSATAADIPRILELERHTAAAAHWSREQYQQALDRSAPEREVLVIEEDARIHGFLVARGVEQEWEIENIAIAASAQGGGLGTRLVGEFLDYVRSTGAQSVFLEVRESNQAARALYKKWGFIESGRRPAYYRNPDEDAVICWRLLL
ncbi:MAG TPA: ribosomal protein S18-alanine N-acetyltransferase [Terriglobales bacterium]